jgi:hypothetical protein
MTPALQERLRAFEGSDDLGNGDFSVCHEAADALDAKDKEIERLRTVLEFYRDAGDYDRAVDAGTKALEALS